MIFLWIFIFFGVQIWPKSWDLELWEGGFENSKNAEKSFARTRAEGAPAPFETPAHPGPKGPRYEKNLPLLLPRNENWKKIKAPSPTFSYISDHVMIRREQEKNYFCIFRCVFCIFVFLSVYLCLSLSLWLSFFLSFSLYLSFVNFRILRLLLGARLEEEPRSLPSSLGESG